MKIMIDFTKWDRMQPYDIKEMTESYYQLYQAHTFMAEIKKQEDPKVQAVFMRLHEMNIIRQILEKGEYYRTFIDKVKWDGLKQRITDLCAEIRPDAFALTKMIYISNAQLGPLGNEDLQPYKRFLRIVRA